MINYIYHAEGNKLEKKVIKGQVLTITDYLDKIQYLNKKLNFISHTKNYIKAVHTGETTEYHYTDHLGNIRLSYGRDPETNEIAILKESHYYPFGLQHNGYVGTHRTTGIIEEIGGSNRVIVIHVRNYMDDSYRYTFGGKEEQLELGLNWLDFHARNYMPDIVRTMTMDPLADKFVTLSPYSFLNNSPLRYTDPTGMAAEEWVKKDGKYFWDDRVVDQATAEEHHGEEAKHIGVNKVVSTVVNGEKVDSVALNEDGTVTKDGKTLTENSNKTFKNKFGSTFQPRQTNGSFVSFGFDGALLGGFGLQIGLVSDALGDVSFFVNFNGNLGFGLSLGLEAGTMTPTGGHQFLNTDFDGNSSVYNVGVSTPIFDASWQKGGSIEKNWHARKKMHSSNFGDHERGYNINSSGSGPGGSWGANGIYSFGTTKVF